MPIVLLIGLVACESILEQLLKYDEQDSCYNEQSSFPHIVYSPFDNTELALLTTDNQNGIAIIKMQRGVEHACFDSSIKFHFKVQVDAQLFPDEGSRPFVSCEVFVGSTKVQSHVFTEMGNTLHILTSKAS